MDNPIVLQSKRHGLSSGIGMRDAACIHKRSQQTITMSFLFLRWSWSNCGCRSAHLRTQLQQMSIWQMTILHRQIDRKQDDNDNGNATQRNFRTPMFHQQSRCNFEQIWKSWVSQCSGNSSIFFDISNKIDISLARSIARCACFIFANTSLSPQVRWHAQRCDGTRHWNSTLRSLWLFCFGSCILFLGMHSVSGSRTWDTTSILGLNHVWNHPFIKHKSLRGRKQNPQVLQALASSGWQVFWQSSRLAVDGEQQLSLFLADLVDCSFHLVLFMEDPNNHSCQQEFAHHGSTLWELFVICDLCCRCLFVDIFLHSSTENKQTSSFHEVKKQWNKEGAVAKKEGEQMNQEKNESVFPSCPLHFVAHFPQVSPSDSIFLVPVLFPMSRPAVFQSCKTASHKLAKNDNFVYDLHVWEGGPGHFWQTCM